MMIKFCKNCQKETHRNTDGKCKLCVKQRSADYYLRNSQKIKEQVANYKAENLDKYKKYSKDRYEKNKEEIKKVASEWQKNNKDRSNARKAKWASNNSEKVKATANAWAKANKEARLLAKHTRRAKLASSGGTLTKGIKSKLFALQKGKCPCCNKSLGKNYHVDHIIPIAKGGKNIDSNVQLLRAKCNHQKNAKDPIEYMQSKGFLL